MTRPARTLVLAAALALAAAPVGAQVADVAPARGWIGVSFDIKTTVDGSRARTVSLITDVMEGSPAAEAGIRPGDVLISINGRDWTEEYMGTAKALRVGDPVRLVVERGGRRQEIRLTAATRPASVVVAPDVMELRLTLPDDSIVERLYRAMDSLRLRITEDEGLRYPLTGVHVTVDSMVRGMGQERVVRLRRPFPEPSVVIAPFDAPLPEAPLGILGSEARAPFAFSFFRTAAADSLQAEMEALNEEIRSLRSRQVTRGRELEQAAAGDKGRIQRGEAELARIAEQLARMSERADGLRKAMEELAQREARGERSLAFTWSAGERPGEVVEVRPTLPYVLGQNRVAGAEVVDLRPELAEYFQVEGGVLVVDVVQGTPAGAAGIQPGDVLTHVDGAPLRSIADLRRWLTRPVPELPVTLVRKGRTVQVLLRR
ncbi:MAG: PDZ domain-containing protein [Longimicrobiales bacterium]|nr:PDZ domain-containing protein [Longimicrobiales bacterium]